MKWLVVMAIVFASHTARADDYPCFCSSNTDYPDKGIPAGPDGTCESADRCQCSASCSGGGGSSGQVNPAVANGAVKVFGAIFLTIGIMILPGHAAQLLSKERENPATARKAFDDYVAKRKRLIQAGLDAQKLRDEYWKADREARAELGERVVLQRKLLEQKLLKPLVPRLLDASRDPHFQCDQARTAMPSIHAEGPIGPFENETQMLETCEPFAEKPVGTEACSATTYRCGVGLKPGDPELCCPRTHPRLNQCDWQCYRSGDFLGAGPGHDEGRHCSSSVDCATFNPTTPLPPPTPPTTTPAPTP